MSCVLFKVAVLLALAAQTPTLVSPAKPRAPQRPTIHSFRNILTKSAPNTRIFGGSEASEGKYPYMVFFMYSPDHDFYIGTSSCSGALLTAEWVLLAAHCFQDRPPVADGVILVAGKADLSTYVSKRFGTPFWNTIDEKQFGVQERRADQAKIHPDYGIADKIHDIALVRVKTPFFIVQDSVRTLPLSREMMKTRTPCTILGWGLSEGNQRTYHLVYADDVYARSVSEGCQYKTEGNFLCLEKSTVGICQGDSGSPLVCNNKIWGVASHLVSYEDQPDCGDDFEEYYEELWYDLNWVDEQMKTISAPTPGGGVQEQDGPGAASRPQMAFMMTVLTAVVTSSVANLCR